VLRNPSRNLLDSARARGKTLSIATATQVEESARMLKSQMLSGKRALVTGSTSGIGLAIARALAGAGAEVVLNGLGDPDEIAVLCAELGAAYHGANLMLPEEIAAMMAAIGPIDILVNNAGMQHVAPVEDFPPEKWDAILALNLSAAFHTTRLAVPGMKAKGWGRIIATASAHSLTASPFKSAYVAAKHAMAGFTKTIALELATHGITANCISPGYVWTPLVEGQIPDTMAARGMTREQVMNDVLLAKQPTKQFVQPEDVAALALFLCGDAARGITGANYSIDGGWTAE
jgi:3-hydroxybutyrate dehydrogenase